MIVAGLKKALIAAALLLGSAIVESVNAASLQLAWNPSTSTDIVNYRVYVGTAARQYPISYDAGASTSFSVTNLVPGTTYHFAVTAVNSAGIESDFSADIAGQVGGGTGETGPILTAARLSTGAFEVRVEGTPSTVYIIDRSDDLNQWTTATTQTANAQGVVTFRPSNISRPHRFFRVRQQ